MSGVLESSRQALLIGRIVSLIGRLFVNRLGQKGVRSINWPRLRSASSASLRTILPQHITLIQCNIHYLDCSPPFGRLASSSSTASTTQTPPTQQQPKPHQQQQQHTPQTPHSSNPTTTATVDAAAAVGGVWVGGVWGLVGGE
eukprot:scaffold10845_cov103-Skeletonema_dohrnii-CCMP3373.AAC.3